MTLLQPGDTFPALEINVSEGTLSLPGDLNGSYAAVLFNRGSWCPFCTTQLAAFQRALPELSVAGIRVVSTSVDDAETVAELVASRGLGFPVGHSADARELADKTGAFLNLDPVYVQSTGFVLDPEGRVVVSVYSSGAIGRLVPEDVLGLVRYHSQHVSAAAT